MPSMLACRAMQMGVGFSKAIIYGFDRRTIQSMNRNTFSRACVIVPCLGNSVPVSSPATSASSPLGYEQSKLEEFVEEFSKCSGYHLPYHQDAVDLLRLQLYGAQNIPASFYRYLSLSS
jgi:hypothetical protein